MIQVVRHKLEEEIVFIIATVIAIVTSFIVRPDYSAIDLRVLCALLNLMLISLAFETYHLLDGIAIYILNKAHTMRAIGWVMILLSAAMGMLMTNDVALLTVVPITLAIGRKGNFDPLKIIVLETAAANIGSSLTPFGNPQNLYLYHHFQIDTLHFLTVTAPFTLVGLFALMLLNSRTQRTPLSATLHPVIFKHPRKLLLYGILFLLVIASVLRLLDYRLMTPLVLFTVFVLDRKLYKKVDYYLLLTFVSFFIAIDNITRLPWIHTFISGLLDNPLHTYLTASLLSQGISNVPAAILLSGFTQHVDALLLGVSIGGLGTLVASLANLISYKLYCRSHSGKHYRAYFYPVNFALLVILGMAVALRWVI